MSDLKIPPLTCSEKDLDWVFTLPVVVDEAIFEDLNITLVSELEKFVFDDESIVVLGLSYGSKLARGKVCP